MLNNLINTFERFGERNALFVKEQYYTYHQLSESINAIKDLIKDNVDPNNSLIGIVALDDFETYASFLAAWFAGVGFVPLNPKIPYDRNNRIIDQSDISLVLSSKTDISKIIDGTKIKVICTKGLTIKAESLSVPAIPDNQIMTILFTSGSTGIPKGVPMTLQNINATLDSFWDLGYILNENDRFLQMFEFTFDMSMLSYLPAFLIGACVYSIADAKVKYLAAIKMMQLHDITFAAMVPSTLAFSKPYFNELKLEKLKYSLIGGEPFTVKLAMEWAECVPNATIVNISGPTETTMACMGYTLHKDWAKNKASNGILAFGKPWKNTKAILVDEQLKLVSDGELGELCFSGDNVMNGYWKMSDKNNEVFFVMNMDRKECRFYRTGDMAYRDQEGDYMTCGRTDQQVKIQGHRVELAEIEALVREHFNIMQVSALVNKDSEGISHIYLFVENYVGTLQHVTDYLKTKLPWYMIPNEIITIKNFPLNVNGKIDRKALLDNVNKHGI